MNNRELAARLEGELDRLLAPQGVEVVDVQYLSAGGSMVLRVFIDVPEGAVDLKRCEEVSRQVSRWLDEEDPIPGSYLLEVSSPGIDRILKKDRDFERFTGHQVKVKLREKLEDRRNLIGCLAGFNTEEIRLQTDEKTWIVPRRIISQVRLVAEL